MPVINQVCDLYVCNCFLHYDSPSSLFVFPQFPQEFALFVLFQRACILRTSQ